MKKTSWFKYLLYFSLIFGVAYGGQKLSLLYKNSASPNPYFYLGIMFIIYAGIGLLFGLDHLEDQLDKSGLMKFNFPKLFFMGIPSFYFSLSYFFTLNSNTFIHDVIGAPAYFLMAVGGSSSITIAIFQVLFGYSIITSFYKNDKMF